MSRTPNSRKEETHERIVDVAARAIRRDGYAGVGVADVMKEAGLTHGGFYAHFDSRDALLVEALERAGRESAAAVARARRGAGGQGRQRLPVARRGLSRRRAPRVDSRPAVRWPRSPARCRASRAPCARRRRVRVRRLIARRATALARRARARRRSVVAGTLVGTLQLARALGDNAEGRAVLAAARKALIQQYDTPARRPR